MTSIYTLQMGRFWSSVVVVVVAVVVVVVVVVVVGLVVHDNLIFQYMVCGYRIVVDSCSLCSCEFLCVFTGVVPVAYDCMH